MYTLHMYVMTHYADLSRELKRNLEENSSENHFLKGFSI